MERALILGALAVSASAFTAPAVHRPAVALRNAGGMAGSPAAVLGRSMGTAPRRSSALLSLNMGDITMPALSSTMKEGKIVQWTVNEGQKVSAGDVLMVVESDKADMDVEAFEDGYIAKILVQEGDTATVGAAVALIAPTEAEIAAVAAGGAAPAAAAAAPADAAPAAGGGSVDAPAVLMPALSSTMKEGKIVQWIKSEGDKIESGDVLMVVESDKADMDVESFEEGYLAAIVCPEGDVAVVGNPVAYLAETKDDIPRVKAAAAAAGPPAAAAAAPASAAPAAAPAPKAAAPAAAPSAVVATGARVVASPLAKKMAVEKGVSLEGMAGSGPGGRIIARDVESMKPGQAGAPKPSGYQLPAGVISASPQAKKAAKKEGVDWKTVRGTGLGGRITEDDVLAAAGKPSAKPAAAVKATREAPELPDGIKAMSGMQVAVARNMEATMEAPSFQVSRKIRTDRFDELYASLKPRGVTVSALLSKAVALTIEKHPIVNAHYDKATNSIVYKKDVNIANAVAIDGGLITPVLKNANLKDIMSISADWKDLVGKAKGGGLRPDEFQSGTFTISNLGMFGVSSFGSLLPPGNGAILAVAGANPTVVMKNGQPSEVKMMEVTLTADHRHIYGADSALFLKDLADLLENDPISIVI